MIVDAVARRWKTGCSLLVTRRELPDDRTADPALVHRLDVTTSPNGVTRKLGGVESEQRRDELAD
jgi:hypothetical protein